jgi:hypothetical protein
LAVRRSSKPGGACTIFGEHSITDLAEVFSISRPTVYRILQRTVPISAGLAPDDTFVNDTDVRDGLIGVVVAGPICRRTWIVRKNNSANDRTRVQSIKATVPFNLNGVFRG